MSLSRQEIWQNAIRELRKLDPLIDRWLTEVGTVDDFAIDPRLPVYEFLARSIISQQISGAAARSILKKFQTAFPRGKIDFKSIARMSVEQMRPYGLSRNKALSLLDLAHKVVDGTLPHPSALTRMDDAQIIEKLTVVRGIGVWTVQMMLMFRLGRMDVMPVGDLVVQKGFHKLLGRRRRSKPKHIEQHSRRWSPYRTVIAKLCWKIG